MEPTTSLCLFDPGEDQLWDHYVQDTPGASWVHLSGWKRVIERVYKHRGFYLWIKEGDVVKGILPLIFMRTLTQKPILVSLPFLDAGGVCGDMASYYPSLLEEARGLAHSLKVKTVELRHSKESLGHLPSFQGRVSMILELPENSELLWKNFDSKLRNQIRKAMKSELSFRWGEEKGIR